MFEWLFNDRLLDNPHFVRLMTQLPFTIYACPLKLKSFISKKKSHSKTSPRGRWDGWQPLWYRFPVPFWKSVGEWWCGSNLGGRSEEYKRISYWPTVLCCQSRFVRLQSTTLDLVAVTKKFNLTKHARLNAVTGEWSLLTKVWRWDRFRHTRRCTWMESVTKNTDFVCWRTVNVVCYIDDLSAYGIPGYFKESEETFSLDERFVYVFKFTSEQELITEKV